MQDALRKTPLGSLSPTQLIALGLVVVIVLFLAIGSIADARSPEPELAVGLQKESFAVLAMFAFAGGLLSFASPCTLPILPAYFAFASQSGRKGIAVNTIAFMVGLGTMFSLLGATASRIGQVLHQNQGLILLIGGAIILYFGVLSLLGKGFTGLRSDDQAPSNTLSGSFLFGLTFAVGWSSCVGPILGTVLTLAGNSGTVGRGVMLGFIYTLGLGLPLIIVSTFFGRASRQSLFWRILRGKGWSVTAPTFLLALVWALAIWLILVSVARYAFATIASLQGQALTPAHVVGLLVITVLGAALWVFAGPGERRTELHLHSTSLVSGALFILLGYLMVAGRLTVFNSLASTDVALWLIGIEERLVTFFTAGP
jgi:cytochrome c-type biogenesis protein